MDVPALKGDFRGLALTQPNTALALTLARAALVCLGPEGDRARARWASPALAAAAAAIGLLTLAEYASGLNLRIDRLLFGDAPGSSGLRHPGRMSAMTAVCVSCLGLALLSLGGAARAARRASQALALAAALLALLDLIGYAYGVRFLDMASVYSTMALHTAATLLVLGLGTVAARPGSGPMRRLTADDAGGLLLRSLLPLSVALALLAGGLRVLGEEAGLFDPRSGSAGLVLCTIVTLSSLLWWTAGRLSRIDAERGRAGRGERERGE